MSAPDDELVTDPDELVALYDRDRAVHVYGLADLDEPWWGRSTWWRRGDAALGVVPLGDGATACYAVSTADPDGTLELLARHAHELPAGTLLTGPVGSLRTLAALRPVNDLGRHTKLVLAEPERLPAPTGTVPLGPGDVERVLALHAADPGAAYFLPAMLDHGVFAGVEGRDGALVAVSGTHAVSRRHGVAALGGVLTHPRHRNRGHAARATAAVCAALADEVTTIGLNVLDANEAASGLWRRIGFREVWRYEEVELP